MLSRHELSAIISATAVAGGPLFILGEVLERRARAGAGLSPAEVRAAQHLIAAAREMTAQDQSSVAPGTGDDSVVPLFRDRPAKPAERRV